MPSFGLQERKVMAADRAIMDVLSKVTPFKVLRIWNLISHTEGLLYPAARLRGEGAYRYVQIAGPWLIPCACAGAGDGAL